MSKLSWRAKAVYIIFALALLIGLSVVAAPAPQQAAAVEPDDEATNTLRVYGTCDLAEGHAHAGGLGYGDAEFPYDHYKDPLSIQDGSNPPKDFIVWNPAYMYHLDPASLGIYGNFFESIVVNGNDANEKVHLRQWYVPKYPEPRGIVWTCQEPRLQPEIVKEYTYMLLDTDNNPQPGLPGMTSFVFPIADNDDTQCGLDDVDFNADGVGDVVYLATTSAVDPSYFDSPGSPGTVSQWYPGWTAPAAVPQPYDLDALWPPYDVTTGCSTATAGLTTTAADADPAGVNRIVGGTKWIDINTDQFAVSVGDEIRFLDHAWVITGVSPTGITVESYYSGNSADGSKKTTTIPIGQTASRGRHLISVEDLTLMAGGIQSAFYQSPPLPPSQSDRFRVGVSKLQLVLQPGYLQVITSGATSAQIVVGRVIAEGETFFVDGAEYDVAMLYMVPNPENDQSKYDYEYGLKFITIRNPIPKWDPVTLEALTIVKCAVQPGQPIPLLPPFNMEHDMIDDTNIPDALYAVDAAGQPIPHPDVQKPDNVPDVTDLAGGDLATDETRTGMATWLPVADGFGDTTFLHLSYNTIAERRVHDVPPIVEWFEQEAKEPRFDTNLLEEKFVENWSHYWDPGYDPGWAEEQWMWKNIETLPWYYTEFVLPELPDITDPVNNDDGDYILVSSWITQDNVRMKFVYDAIPSALWSADIYVNDPTYNLMYQDVDEMSLRVYGACGEDAEFPYDHELDPFSVQDWSNPPKDFIVWNPAYMYHLDPASLGIYGNFFESIVVNGNDANEKVHLRQWYVPKYTEPRGNVWTCQTPVYWPEIVKEYTYLLLDTDNNPQPGLPGMTSFVFPTSDNDDAQCGLDDVDMNSDGVADVVYLATTSALDPDASAVPVYTNPDGSPWAPNGAIPQPRAGDAWAAPHDALWPPVDTTNACPGLAGESRWIDINTDQFAVSVGDEIRFLDHAWVITGVSPTGITVDSYYSGNSADGSKKTTTIPIGQTASRGRHLISVEDLTLMAGGTTAAFYQSPPLPPSQSDRFRVGVSKLQLVLQPGYLQVITSGATSAQIVVGRVIAEAETFFVDGAEYDVAMIYFVPTPSNGQPKDDYEYGLKFITIRNPIPKWEPVTLEALTIVKCAVQPGQPIPLLPPFNMEHDMIDDVNIPEMVQGMQLPAPLFGLWWPDLQMPDNLEDELDVLDNVETFFASLGGTLTPVLGPDGFGDVSFLNMAYNTIAERRVQDVPAIVEWFKHEAKEPRFDTNLLEEKFVEDASEDWHWKNIETYPWLYTEFVLPELPEAEGLEAMGKIGDYILVSSFMSQWYNPLGCIDPPIRMKFVYDAAFSPDHPEKTGIYVNTIGVAPEPELLVADADGPYYGLPDESIAISGSATGGTEPYSWAWDLDYDGLYDDSFVQNPTWSWSVEGDYTIGLKVTDSAMAEDTDTAIVHVSEWNPWDYDTNEDEVIDIGEVLAAIVDYFDGVINISQVLDVIVLYFLGL